MANELNDNNRCGTCKHYKYTDSPWRGFCAKRKIVTKETSVCGTFTPWTPNK